jgi:hypothetical protein
LEIVTSENCGAARGIRTPDPVITNDVLYRLSYCGETAISDIGSGAPWQAKHRGKLGPI